MHDTANLLAEVAVGNEPRFVALNPDDQEAYVTNALGGMVSVVALSGPVGTFDATDPSSSAVKAPYPANWR